MSIKGNVGKGLVDVLTTDTTLLELAADKDRQAVSALVLHNTTGASITVDIWESPDTTSASGEKIAQYAIGANASVDVVEAIGQGYSSTNLIAQASAVDVVSRATVVEYDGGD